MASKHEGGYVMKSNRAARRLFGAFGKISNTRRIEFRKCSDHWSGWEPAWIERFALTRRQRRARRIGNYALRGVIFGMSRALKSGQHTQGERD